MSDYDLSPKVSVLMPVHNAVAYLEEALESIAAQTWTNFEVVAVDDGSTDGSGARLMEHAKKWEWLRVISCETKGGIATALNTGFHLCRGELIARMDADDVCLPERFARQVAFMDTHPEVGLCGGAARMFGEGQSEVIRPPIGDDEIRAWLVFGSAFIHPAVMFRRAVVQALDGPYSLSAVVEDYDLWLRLAAVTRFHNLPEELLCYRLHAAQYTATKTLAHQAALDRLRFDWLRARGFDFDQAEASAHRAVAFDRGVDTFLQPLLVANWLRRLLREIPPTKWCGRHQLGEMVAERWWAWVQEHCGGFRGALVYAAGPWARLGQRELRRLARITLRRQMRSS